MGGDELLGEIITEYLQYSPTRLTAIREAIAINDANELRMAAHNMRSTSGNLGGVSLGNICNQLESLGRAGTTKGAAELFPLLEVEYEAFKHELINFKSGKNLEVLESEIGQVPTNISSDDFSDQIESEIQVQSVLDLIVLDSIRQTAGTKADDIIKEIIHDYFHDTPEQIQIMLDAITMNSIQDLKKTAQFLHSSSANIGAITIVDLCEQMTDLTSSNFIEKATELLLEIDAEFEKVINSLKKNFSEILT